MRWLATCKPSAFESLLRCGLAAVWAESHRPWPFARKIGLGHGWLAASVLVAALASAEERNLVVPRDGSPFAGRLTGFDEGGKLTFATRTGSHEMPIDDLVLWGTVTDTGDATQVVFIDGSLLVADVMKVSEHGLIVESKVWRPIEVPRHALRGAIFQPPADPPARDALVQRLLAQRAGRGRLRLVNGDELDGALLPTPSDEENPLFGLEELHFALAGSDQRMVLALGDVVALEVAAAAEHGPPARAPATWLGFRDGSVLQVTGVSRSDDQVQLRLACGAHLLVDEALFVPHVTLVQPMGPHVRYLSDQQPLDYKHLGWLDTEWPLGLDRNSRGGRLRTAGNVQLKGLGMHSTSRLVFDLAPEHRRFEAELAIDDVGQPWGSVVYRVALEYTAGQGGESHWEVVYESPTVRAGQTPIRLKLDLDGATRIALIVGFAERGDVLDHANWLNARFVR